ncbi:MAG: B12-binding domain-containing radical SAM protein [Proteobacteria bacterium]|jgi:radical SAM superfamily enzyme YgiQ (UPF0313 family)|nr:B12-binding domain-containing radical SAM protein [Pseudomonadota bacterium]
MKVKLILPALIEATSPGWRPIKYSLFPPLGLATLAAFLDVDDEVEIVDEHVEPLILGDSPHMVLISVYITNARRAYQIADHYRQRGIFVALGGLHVTSLPHEAARHGDTIFLGPAEQSFPTFLRDFKNGHVQEKYTAKTRTLCNLPPPRRDLIDRSLYLVPNSIVVSRGCPHSCNFCYKHSFFAGGRQFYVQPVDEALEEIERLEGRHLYFLDDHLLGNPRFARSLFDGMIGMNRVFQGAATVGSILKGDLIERAAEAGLRSIFIGFETLDSQNLSQSNKAHNLGPNYDRAIERLHDLGVLINGSFVFGLDNDGPDVFARTVEWAVSRGITTATFHVLTPYPNTSLHHELANSGRILHSNWDLYDTRHVVYQPLKMSPIELRQGYDWAYKSFYSWKNITRGAAAHHHRANAIRHLAYAGAWKKLEPMWDWVIRQRTLRQMRPMLESLLSLQPNRQLLPTRQKAA